MIEVLKQVIKDLPVMLTQRDKWDSIIVNKRKPHTYRAFYQYGDYRVCLHRFEGCDEHESFYHPHGWPAAFTILSGAYKMRVGYSKDRTSKPEPVATFELYTGSVYEMVNPLAWHAIIPITDACYTIMVNGVPYSKDEAHEEVRTTKGKDLQAMTKQELDDHLDLFASFPLF